MEIAFYFFGIALVVASVFLMLDTQQNRRLNRLAKDTRNVQPLFLQRSAEQKLNTLNSFLYDQTPKEDIITTSAWIKLNDNARRNLSAQLNMINNERNSGKISLQTYNGKLNELLDKTRNGR